MRVAVGIVVVAALAAGCGGHASTAPVTTTKATASAPELRATACPASVGAGYRCATLTVPLHRRGARVHDGRALRLAVALQNRPHPRGDLVLLTGGPGQPGLPFAPRMRERLRTAARGYRLVFVDQRGTGATAIRCPALQEAAGTSDLAVPPASAVAACARRLGPARDAYGTADTVADLDALRRALHDARWTIGGISYGTFVAERYALAHPEATRALVLDSVVPQEGAELLSLVPLRATARVLGPAATADLRRVLAEHSGLGPRVFDLVTERSIGVPRLDAVGTALHTAAAGDLTPLRALLTQSEREARGVPVAFFSSGLHAATLCADAPTPAREITTKPTSAQTAPWPPSTALHQGLLATCRAWPPPAPPPPAPPRTATIRAPALLLAGDHDLSTPLEWARAQARRMPSARLVVVRGAGHSILSREPGDAGRAALRSVLQR